MELNSQENMEEIDAINSLEMLNINLSKSQSENLTHKNYDLHDVGIKLFPGIYKNKNFNSDNGSSNTTNDTNSNVINNNNINYNNYEDNEKRADLDNFINKNNFKKSIKDDIECENYLHKANSHNINFEPKNGLELAFDYYSSFFEDKKK